MLCLIVVISPIFFGGESHAQKPPKRADRKVAGRSGDGRQNRDGRPHLKKGVGAKAKVFEKKRSTRTASAPEGYTCRPRSAPQPTFLPLLMSVTSWA